MPPLYPGTSFSNNKSINLNKGHYVKHVKNITVNLKVATEQELYLQK